MQGAQTAAERVEIFFGGGRFPAFAVSLLVLWEVVLVGLLLAPGGSTGLGAFADEFRVWCFGYDPATGRLEAGYVMGMLTPPLMLAAMFALFWLGPLRELARRPSALAAPVLCAAVLVAGAAGGFTLLRTSSAGGELPFPAEALRTAHRAPEFIGVNQAGDPVEIAEFRGKVVLLTAVYASCPHSCPAILTQARESLAGLSEAERADVRVVAVTMDPENDSPQKLAELANMHGLDLPVFNLLTGDPPEVERVLDEMSVARYRDPETGVIEHPNLFLLLDRDGHVAYRLGLGERQQQWLSAALRILLGEAPDAG
ncbi:MAG: SCO family protein [Deltaproteobacteria bacterium]|nr:SCO family protein [Deltaproteobacteria bacterium]